MMDVKPALVLGGSIVAAALILGSFVSPKAARSSAPVGRYQMGGVPGHAYVLDTQTGQVWESFASSGSGSSDLDFSKAKVKE
jgi:hypothetical protein